MWAHHLPAAVQYELVNRQRVAGDNVVGVTAQGIRFGSGFNPGPLISWTSLTTNSVLQISTRLSRENVFIQKSLAEKNAIATAIRGRLNQWPVPVVSGGPVAPAVPGRGPITCPFLGTSHPISGSEVSGPEYGSKTLFLNKWCIIVSDKNKKNINKVVNFWKKLGSKVILMDPYEHDKIFALTSHLPHLVAYNLIRTAQDFQKKQKKNIIKFSAGGLRDFSRIAASNEIMWRDVFFNNKKNMINAINIFIKNLNSFKKNIKTMLYPFWNLITRFF
mgnify:CR=1 FL=1